MGANRKPLNLVIALVVAAIALLLVALFLLNAEPDSSAGLGSSTGAASREGELPARTDATGTEPTEERPPTEGERREGESAADPSAEGVPGRVSVVGGGTEAGRVPPPHRAGPYTLRRYPDGGLSEAPRGRLEPAVIQDVVREHLGQLRFCFEWQLHAHPELGGRVEMEFRIAEDGTVEEARLSDDTLGDETVTDCFRGVVSRMRFPEPEGGAVSVRYPFTLSAGDAPDEATPEAAEGP